MSADGNLVPLVSLATDLVTGDDNGVQDALLFTIPLAAGGGSLQGTLPDDDSLAGVQLFLQSLQPDPSVPHRLAFTPGLELQLGR